ncbi:hypothetical protein [Streptomyces sp. NBC_00443]|uniref:hypothetical protein n=1 Tax=Streptomyces sp. NBC_00443 TaxID=2975743 RepID=UPI002E23FE3F
MTATTAAARSVAQGLTSVTPALPLIGPLLRPGTPGRWPTPGGVQIELRRLGQPGTIPASRELETALRRLPGVTRAEVNGALGCVYVGCGPETDLEVVAGVVEAAEALAEERAGREGAGVVLGGGGENRGRGGRG